MTDRETPSSVEIEKSCLGNVLLSPESLRTAEDLTVDHFFLDSHKRIFKAMLDMDADGVEIDTYTLAETLKSRSELTAAGGPGYLASLTDGVAPRANLTHYVRILAEKKQRRELLMIAANATRLAYDPQANVREAIEKLQEQAMRVSSETGREMEDIFLDVEKFCNQYHAEVDWLVHGVIEKGTNGIMIGASGDGKSPCARALAVCLASGVDWLDMRVKRVRTALVSREDYAGTTSRFIKRFREGNGIDQAFNLGAWLWVHSRQQRKSLLLDKPSDLKLLIDNLKQRQIQFAILDVLNVLHGKDENDNSEMRQVLSCIDRIRDEVGCQVMLLHHAGKAAADSNSVVGAGRGATAMDGFAEFKIRIKTEDEDAGIKSIRFKTKAGEFQKSFFWKIRDLDNGGVTLTREDWNAPNTKRRAAKA